MALCEDSMDSFWFTIACFHLAQKCSSFLGFLLISAADMDMSELPKEAGHQHKVTKTLNVPDVLPYLTDIYSPSPFPVWEDSLVTSKLLNSIVLLITDIGGQNVFDLI